MLWRMQSSGAIDMWIAGKTVTHLPVLPQLSNQHMLSHVSLRATAMHDVLGSCQQQPLNVSINGVILSMFLLTYSSATSVGL